MGGLGERQARFFSESTSRWLFDLQACQTAGSAQRGVGRYSKALFESVAAICPQADIRALVHPALPSGGLPVIAAERLIDTPQRAFDFGERKRDGGPLDDIDSILLSHRIGPWKADLIHVSHVFEGFADGVALPSLAYRAAGQVISATLYDLIPLRFQDEYFANPAVARWYRSRVGWLRQADLLLAISESSRQDAVELLGIDPSRIATIHGGIGAHFMPAADRDAVRRDLGRRYALGSRFVLYAGGDDPRKNLIGAIKAFAAIPPGHRVGCRMVIMCSLEDSRKEALAQIGKQCGLAPEELLLTGFVPERDLVAFYQCCDAFVFPSLYEGLGLPVLEAMACGAPTIAGDNSSLRELVVRKDALFDSRSCEATAAAIAKVLSDRDFAAELGRYGVERAAAFNWPDSAARAVEAFADAIDRARCSGTTATASGWLAKKRLAVLTPLPPSRSGIADYNSEFLHFLARHFEIDIYVESASAGDLWAAACFAIFPAKRFESVGHLYDAILYEFGNSEFHRYMLPLLARFPGIVGLHDAFLSGLYGYLDFNLGDTGSYPRAMIDMHGPRARAFYAPVSKHEEPNGGTMIKLPATKQVLDAAVGVISHSPFNLEVARSNYPEGWKAPYRIIPQMVRRQPPEAAAGRLAIRAGLGYGPDDFVIATFGHIAWTKLGDRLLKAFVDSPLASDSAAHLVFVGELADDPFGAGLSGRIDLAQLHGRIRITGFVSDELYAQYLRAADLAVQLRTKSRGGTPKGVLDCLAYGLPVIINDEASYRDYPSGVTHKLPQDPSAADVAEAILSLRESPARLGELARRGLRHVAEQHDPEDCAEKYAAAIHEFMERSKIERQQSAVDALAPLLARTYDVDAAAQAVARILAERPKVSLQRRRVFIDVSFIAVHDHESGIQRVVKKIVHHFYTMDVAGVEPVAVQLTGGRLHVATSWLAAKGLLHPTETDSIEPDRGVAFAPGDILFMLDSSWARYREFFPIFESARRAHANVFTAVYDLLPITVPPHFIVDGGPAWFKDWLVNGAIGHSDALITISAAVAQELADFIAAEPGLARRPRIGYFHLGSDIDATPQLRDRRAESTATGSRPYLLVVGTIEPRKSHALILDAMELFWRDGEELGLVIAGKKGWLVDDLMDRLRGHPELNKRLRLVENPSDADVSALYEQAQGLLFISLGEGFGLPLVEAANHGLPIVCSDLPVFHEICGDFATYIVGREADKIAAQLAGWWKARQQGRVPDTRTMPRLTWQESARSLLDLLVHQNWVH